MKTLTIDIASYKQIKAMTMAIARGELKVAKHDPKVWFSSIESLAQVLSTKNKVLLEIIAKKEPKNIKELTAISRRQKSNLCEELISVIPYSKLKVNCELFKSKIDG